MKNKKFSKIGKWKLFVLATVLIATQFFMVGNLTAEINLYEFSEGKKVSSRL